MMIAVIIAVAFAVCVVLFFKGRSDGEDDD